MKNGFTLIELLISVVILGIMATAGFAGYRRFAQKEAVASAVNRVMSDMRYAQELAVSGTKPASMACDTPNSLTGVRFSVISAQSYEVSVVCSGGEVSMRVGQLEGGVDILASDNVITFKPLGRGTDVIGSTVVGVCEGSFGAGVFVSAAGEIGQAEYTCI